MGRAIRGMTVHADGVALWRGRRLRCAVGRAGVARRKREGDGATPAGVFPLRRVLYRPDRLTVPASILPARALSPGDGWCDDPDDTAYNRQVALPYPARAEALWREDGAYDLIAVIGHNDDPVRRGLGSAVFLHVARPGYPPTEGCIAMALADLATLLSAWRPDDLVRIEPPPRSGSG